MGSPPGYVGYGEGGVLTEAVRRRPYSVILLDEMEKAHPGVQDIFFQVFDKGNMKDGEGRDIDFKNTVIIMTSNAGTDLITRLFADPETAPDAAGLAEALMPELMKSFKPAFLGRVNLVPYFPLSPEIIRQIVELQLGRIRAGESRNLWRQIRLGRGTGRHDSRALHGDIFRSTQRGEDPVADAAAGIVGGSAVAPGRRRRRSTGSPWAWTRLGRSNTISANNRQPPRRINKGAHRGNLHELGRIDGAVTTDRVREMDRAATRSSGASDAASVPRCAARRPVKLRARDQRNRRHQAHGQASTKLFTDAVAGDLSTTVKIQVHHDDEGQDRHVPGLRADQLRASAATASSSGGDVPSGEPVAELHQDRARRSPGPIRGVRHAGDTGLRPHRPPTTT